MLIKSFWRLLARTQQALVFEKELLSFTTVQLWAGAPAQEDKCDLCNIAKNTNPWVQYEFTDHSSSPTAEHMCLIQVHRQYNFDYTPQ